MKYFLYCRKSTENEERQVLSLQSQREAVDRALAGRGEVEIAGVFEEAKSAKTPGRPIFATMLARIEAGEADGIVSWAPDRLARNSIDGGRIIYLLDTGVLRDLKFATYTFENNSQGKFMLSIMFGQSKYYSDALSENVKRGNRTKLENGWRPNRAPLGYINDPATRTILPHPQHFALVRRMFELVLYERHTARQVICLARDEWGFLTPRSKRSGGKPIAHSTIYKMLANPFYKGDIEWNGATYPGRHVPVVSPEEFGRVQAIIGSRSTPRPSQLSFPFRGVIKCGACGRMITAERKQNRHDSHYTYYHCSARSLSRGYCREPSIEERELDAQLAGFLARIAIPADVAEWVRHELTVEPSAESKLIAERSRTAAISEIQKQLAELTSLRVRRLLSDEEYVESRNQLAARRASLEKAATDPEPRTLFEPFELLVSASTKAVEWFLAADNDGKRAILKITGSNPSLSGGKLSIQAAKPFFLRDDFVQFLRLRGVVDTDRENRLPAYLVRKHGRAIIKELKALQGSSEGRDWIASLRELVHRYEVPDLAAWKAAARRRARGAPRLVLPRVSIARRSRGSMRQ